MLAGAERVEAASGSAGGKAPAAGGGLRIADGDDTIETFAYEICNTDGVDGLSWTEVEQCEELYCDDLPEITCPTKDDFEFFDMDGDGILTWSEWKSVHASNHPDDNTL